MNSNDDYDMENNLHKNRKLYNLYFFLFFIYYAVILIVTGIYYQNIAGQYNINGIIAFLLSTISIVIVIAKIISSFINTVNHDKFTYGVYLLCLIVNCITCIYFALMYEFGGVQDGNTLVIIKDAFFVSLISLVTQNCVSLYLSRNKYD